MNTALQSSLLLTFYAHITVLVLFLFLQSTSFLHVACEQSPGFSPLVKLSFP